MSDITSETQNKKQRLGRGLGSLLGGNDLQEQSVAKPASPAQAQNQAAPKPQESIPAEARIWQIPIEKLIPSPYQPRTHFAAEKIKELADSIKDRGILQPIVARKLNNGSFEIIAGERRWRAAQVAGFFEVPVQLKVLSNKEALEIAIIENVQREDLSPIEEAEAYHRLVREFNFTQQQVAERVGKDRVTVANALRLLQLPLEVREMVSQGFLSQGHAKVLLGLTDEGLIRKLAKKSVADALSVRALEKELKKASSPQVEDLDAPQPSAPAHKAAVEALRNQIQKKLGTKVSVDYHRGSGKIAIHFYSDDELTALAARIVQ
jgi:ParB family chromosome partitioning protein